MSTQPQVPDANALKERQVKIWTAGEYARIGNPIAIMGELLCEAVELQPCGDGPVLARHADVVLDEDGVAHEVTRPVVALCTCGRSQRRPWCDSTHKSVRRP